MVPRRTGPLYVPVMPTRGLAVALVAAIMVVVLPRPALGLEAPAFQQGLDTMRILRVDTFAHRRHAAVLCPTCHDAHSSQRLTFVAPRGCQSCHHQSPEANRCPVCHTPNDLAAPIARTLTVAVRGQPPRPRTVVFRHVLHVTRPCSGCHTMPVWLEPADSVLSCAGCHDDHHQAARACDGCHTERAAFAPHAPPAEAHERCDRCHQARTIARLVPDRSLCLTCHPSRRTHGTPNQCTTCHFLQDPATYRSRLLTGHP